MCDFYSSFFLEDIDFYKKLGDNCDLYSKEEKPISESKKRIEEIGAYKGVLNKCKKYRENQHQNCYYNKKTNKYEGDPGHKNMITLLEETKNKCDKAEKEIIQKIKKSEIEFKPIRKQTIKSLDNINKSKVAKFIRSRHSKRKKHHKKQSRK